MREQEFEALRATIRERGTVRMILLPVTFGLWAGAALATFAVVTLSIGAVLPLLVLAAGFEAIYALHINVERIGRYIQVFHEDAGGWEHVALTFGQRFPGRGPDALFSNLFDGDGAQLPSGCVGGDRHRAGGCRAATSGPRVPHRHRAFAGV